MMDVKRLSDVANVRMGYPFRSRVETAPSGGCLLVQMKDVDVAGGLRENDLVRVEAPPNFLSHVLRPGDVLMAGRGVRNHAVSFPTDPGNTIAAANLFVLRPYGSVLPDYLTWFLNLPATQARLRAKRAGSSVQFVPLAELGDLEIPVPNLEAQNRIVEIYKLSLREEELINQIQTLRRTLVDATLHEAVQRASPHARPAGNEETANPF
jgi:hypothetical protein